MSVMGPLLIFIKYYWFGYFWDKRVLLFWLHKQKNKKIIFGIKECFFSDCTNKQPKKEPQKNPKNNNNKKTKKNHTIVGREKWLLYFQV